MNISGRVLTGVRNQFQRNVAKRMQSVRTASIEAAVSFDNESLVVKNGTGTHEFPLVWLRDNCRCPNCFHADSQSRIINWNEFNIDVKVKEIGFRKENEIHINWDDDHKSTFTYDWLKGRSFSKALQEEYLKENYVPTRKLWGKDDFFNIMHRHDYKNVMSDKKAFYNWLTDLSVYGVVLIENAPLDETECRKLSEKVAFIRKTHYGEDFHVKNKPGTNNVAYLNGGLQLHTDLPYYQYKPGTNLLHCVVQTEQEGGENLLTDVFNIAQKLRKERPEVFKILSKTEVNWCDVGEEDGIKFNKILRSPMICLDSHGNVESIRHSIPQRDSYFSVDLKDVKPWYKAFKYFVSVINDNAAKFKLKPGDILAFDNIRLVHGRMAFKDTHEKQRFLVGHFVDWDEIYSKIRVLKKELNL